MGERAVAEVPQVARIVVAACASWAAAEPLVGSSHLPPVYAVIVPLVAMRDHPYSALNVSIDRLAGVVIGIGIGIGAANWLGVTLPAIALVLAAGLLIGVAARFGPALNVQVAISGLLVFANAAPGSYAVSRLWETGVGAGVTVLLSPLLLPPNARRQFADRLAAVRDDVARLVDRCTVVALAETPSGPAREALRLAAHDAEGRAVELPAAFDRALLAVRRNPLRRRDVAPLSDLRGLALSLARVGPLADRVVEETLDFSGRAGPAWASLRAPLVDVLRGLGRVLVDFPERSALDGVVERFVVWRETDSRPAAAVLRRPIGLLLIELGADPATIRSRTGAPDSVEAVPEI